MIAEAANSKTQIEGGGGSHSAVAAESHSVRSGGGESLLAWVDDQAQGFECLDPEDWFIHAAHQYRCGRFAPIDPNEGHICS